MYVPHSSSARWKAGQHCSGEYCTTWAFNALHCLFIVTSPPCSPPSTLSPPSTPSLLLPPLIYSVGSRSYNPALSFRRSPGLLPRPGIMSKCLISAKLWLMPSPCVVLSLLMSKISLNFPPRSSPSDIILCHSVSRRRRRSPELHFLYLLLSFPFDSLPFAPACRSHLQLPLRSAAVAIIVSLTSLSSETNAEVIMC